MRTAAALLVASLLVGCSGNHYDATGTASAPSDRDKSPQCSGTPCSLASLAWNGEVRSIAVFETDLYWTVTWEATGGPASVMKVPVAGGPPVTLASASDPGGIAVGASGVYWANGGDGTIRRVGLNGGAPVVLASGQGNPNQIALSPTGLYWTNIGPEGPYGSVMMLPPGGSAPVTLATSAFTQGIAVDASNAYWLESNAGPQDGRPAGGNVVKLPFGGTPVAIATNQDNPLRIAMTGTSVYWTNYDHFAPLMTVAVDQSQPNAVVTTEGDCYAIAVDATTVYFTRMGHGLYAAPIAGGAPVALHDADPDAIGLDDTSVYFAAQTQDATVIYRLLK